MPRRAKPWLQHPLLQPTQTKPDVVRRLQAMVTDHSGFLWTQANPEARIGPAPTTRLKDIAARTLVLVGGQDSHTCTLRPVCRWPGYPAPASSRFPASAT